MFKYRSAIAAVFFIVLVLCAKPTSLILPHVLIVMGIGLRLWAAGYIGPDARKHQFCALYVIVNGPYRFFENPLYVGNFFLVLGVVILYNPPHWLGISYIVAFVIMYALIAISEKQYLRGKPSKEVPYKFNNLKGEISTLLVLAVIYVLWFILIVGKRL